MHLLGGRQDGGTDPRVCPAATYVAEPVEVCVGHLPALGVDVVDQPDRVHNLAWLTVAALGHVVVEPSLLHRVELLAGAVGEAFDRHDVIAGV